jgi:hypothetical protein
MQGLTWPVLVGRGAEAESEGASEGASDGATESDADAEGGGASCAFTATSMNAARTAKYLTLENIFYESACS